MKRRTFLASISATPLLAFPPIAAFAEAVTVGTIIKAVAAIVSAAKELEEKRNFTAWRNDTTARLAAIEQNTIQIIRDLQQLRIDVKEIVISNSRNEFLARLESANIVLRSAVAEAKQKTPLRKKDKELLYVAASQVLMVLGQTRYKDYGFSTMPMVLASFSTYQAVMRLAGYVKAADQSKLDLLNNYFLPSLDVAEPGSFAWALEVSRNEMIRLRTSIADGMRAATVGYRSFSCVRPAVPDIEGTYRTRCGVYRITTTFSGSADDASSIQATPLEHSVAHKSFDPGWISLMYMSTSPPAVIPGAAKAFSDAQAEDVRQQWLGIYRKWANDLAAEKVKSADLAAYIELIRESVA